MANNCVGISFDMSCDGSGNYQDSGDYLNDNGLPFCCGDVSQQGMSASNCRELASDIFCGSMGGGSMGGQTQLSALSSQMVQKRRIPPLGPKATMRRATGGGKTKVATAVNWLSPLI